MSKPVEFSLISQCYSDVFGARVTPCFPAYQSLDRCERASAALGYRRADSEPLFLECYLDLPVEDMVGAALGRVVSRNQIVEIGNFAACNGHAMIELWGSAANDLAGSSEIAVATLTAPLRKMFARIGVPVHPLASARAEACPVNREGEPGQWGSYYAHDPIVCFGEIARGQDALARFVARRQVRAAA